MEDTLRALNIKSWELHERGLNPCFNGRYSQSCTLTLSVSDAPVLILVLMEDTLRVNQLLCWN